MTDHDWRELDELDDAQDSNGEWLGYIAIYIIGVVCGALAAVAFL